MAEKSTSPNNLTSGDKPKGILKHSTSIDDQRTEVHWDEMNILQTYHPEGKDYGHMKINEPPTPYNYRNDDSDVEENAQLDPLQLAEKMKSVPPDAQRSPDQDDEQSDSDDDNTPEQQEVKKAFKDKRKHHYNEYSNVKLARELIKKELAELDDEDTQGS